MPSSFGYAIWLICTLLEAAVVVCAISKHSFRRYFCLNLYMSASVLVSIGRFVVFEKYGFLSSKYAYVYQYTDVLLTIFLYFALITLYGHVFDEMKAEKFVRLTAAFLLIGTAVFSYSVVQQSSHRMLTHFFFELSQNLYFVGLVLTYVLWGAILKLRETRIRLIQLVLSLGMYFSVFAASFALRNLSSPAFQSVWAYLPPIFSCLLPLAWAYAFWRLPEEARLATSRLAVVPR